jgi:transposase
MLTTMTESEWAIVLQVFRASRSRRGDKGRDDRKFLEALQYFAVHNITWRALPRGFGHWNSVWKRFWLEPVRNLRGLLRCACGHEAVLDLIQFGRRTVAHRACGPAMLVKTHSRPQGPRQRHPDSSPLATAEDCLPGVRQECQVF